jgi:hypothetical protein
MKKTLILLPKNFWKEYLQKLTVLYIIVVIEEEEEEK